MEYKSNLNNLQEYSIKNYQPIGYKNVFAGTRGDYGSITQIGNSSFSFPEIKLD